MINGFSPQDIVSFKNRIIFFLSDFFSGGYCWPFYKNGVCFVLIKVFLFYLLIGITWHPPNLPGHKVFETGEGLPAIYVRVSRKFIND